MSKSEIQNENTIYLITTQRADAPLLKYATHAIDLKDSDIYWKFLRDHVIPYTPKEISAAPSKKKLFKHLLKTQFKSHEPYGIEYTKNITYIKNFIKLISSIQRIGTTNVYITHHWYSDDAFLFEELENSNTSNCEPKHKFLAIIFEILRDALKQGGVEIKLFSHDMDIFDRRMKGTVVSKLLLSTYLIDIEYTELLQMIKKERVYVSQHGDKSMFYQHVLCYENIDELDTRLDDFLVVSKEFADLSLETVRRNGIDNQYIRIRLKFSSGLEFQFFAVLNQIIEFNHHAWKVKKRFIPPIFEPLINQVILDDTESSNARQKLLKLTQMPMFISSERDLTPLTNDGNSLIDLAPRARYIDSSIWMRYAKIKDTEVTNSKGDDPEKSQKENATAKRLFPEDFGIYKTSNAHEVREFNSRLCANSRLIDYNTGQSKNITPFPFCSETNSEEKANKQYENFLSKIDSEKFVMKILLIDDKSKIEDKLKPYSHNKLDVIASVLGRNHDDKAGFYVITETNSNLIGNNKGRPTIIVDYAHTLAQAKSKLATTKYDVLFLDYLLEYDEKSELKSKCSYGTELLKEMLAEYESVYAKGNKKHQVRGRLLADDHRYKDILRTAVDKRGPLKKFWIFFISTFSSAIREDMRVNDMHYSEDIWLVERGACPGITPHLFRNNFLHLLNKLIDELTDIGIEQKKRIITVADLLYEIFSSKRVKATAIKHFNSLLMLKSHYAILYNDYYSMGKAVQEDKAKKKSAYKYKVFASEEIQANPIKRFYSPLIPAPPHNDTRKAAHANKDNGSLLVQTLFPDLRYYGRSFWEHLQHLIYLVAYGNPSQAVVMWHEYSCIEHILKKVDADQDTNNDEENKKLCSHIERHITKLIEQNNA